MDKVIFKINGSDMEATVGSTILEAARLAGVKIPTLCHLKGLNETGGCRMCVVEVKGAKGLMPSCVTVVTTGMEIWTDSPVVLESRRTTLDLICSKHRMDCEYCVRYSDCELHALVRHYGLDDRNYTARFVEPQEEKSSDCLIRDYSKCVLCRRCVAACEGQSTNIIGILNRGDKVRVSPPLPLAETGCVGCGQCISACPTGALREKDDTQRVWNVLNNHGKHVVALVSPFVGDRLAECFTEPIEMPTHGRVVAMMRRLGFDKVFDATLGAQAAATREADELTARLDEKGRLPLISSNCPAVVRFCENHYPELAENLSKGKSPREIMGELCKTKYAEQAGIDTKDIVVVSIDSCTASKWECRRPGATIDIVITTRELASMIKRACVSRFTTLRVWRELPEESFDSFAAADCQKTLDSEGGIGELVMKKLGSSSTHRWVSVSGLAKGKELLDATKSGESEYDYIEILACPGGCINGGGQPRNAGIAP